MLAHTEVNVWPLRSNTDWVLEPDCAAITGKWQHFHSITEPIIIKVIDDTERERERERRARVRGSQTLLLSPLSCCHKWIRGWLWWTWTRRSHWNLLIKCNRKKDWSFILIQNQVNNCLVSNQQTPPISGQGTQTLKYKTLSEQAVSRESDFDWGKLKLLINLVY